MNQKNNQKKGFSGNRSRGRNGSGGRGFGGGNRGSFRKNSFNDGPREMHKAICSDCKQNCEVPFKPTEGKPVYCRECYSKHKKY